MPVPTIYLPGDRVVCVREDSSYLGQTGTIVSSTESRTGIKHVVRWSDQATPTYRDDSLRAAPKPVSLFISETTNPSPPVTVTKYVVPAGTRNYRRT